VANLRWRGAPPCGDNTTTPPLGRLLSPQHHHFSPEAGKNCRPARSQLASGRAGVKASATMCSRPSLRLVPGTATGVVLLFPTARASTVPSDSSSPAKHARRDQQLLEAAAALQRRLLAAPRRLMHTHQLLLLHAAACADAPCVGRDRGVARRGRCAHHLLWLPLLLLL
jgi:hypothetical protein